MSENPIQHPIRIPYGIPIQIPKGIPIGIFGKGTLQVHLLCRVYCIYTAH